MSSYKLVSFDLDGTLLHSSHTFSTRTRAVLRSLYAKGIHIVFATGRPYTVVRRLVGSPSSEDYLFRGVTSNAKWFCVASNGACVYDAEGHCMYADYVNPEICAAMYRLVPPSDLLANLNVFLAVGEEDRKQPGYHNVSDRGDDISLDEWKCQRVDEKEAAYQAGSFFYPEAIDTFPDHQRTTGVTELFFLCYDEERRAELRREIIECARSVEEKLGKTNMVRISPSMPHCLDVVPWTMNKLTGVLIVAKQLSLSIEECVAFGDGMNDAELLRDAGRGFVMGNASDELKESLPENEVIGHHNEDAVAITLEKLFNL